MFGLFIGRLPEEALLTGGSCGGGEWETLFVLFLLLLLLFLLFSFWGELVPFFRRDGKPKDFNRELMRSINGGGGRRSTRGLGQNGEGAGGRSGGQKKRGGDTATARQDRAGRGQGEVVGEWLRKAGRGHVETGRNVTLRRPGNSNTKQHQATATRSRWGVWLRGTSYRDAVRTRNS